MSSLQNFPMLNQRTTTTSNGQLDVNRDWDCVAECVAAAMSWYTGHRFEGGILKELIYGPNYQGGTAATAYVQYCMQHGVKFSSQSASENAQLVILAHGHIRAGHPVILTEIDPYCTAYERDVLGWSHVVCAYSEDVGSITVMDPFGGFPVTKSDAQWAQDLRFGEIWIFAPIAKEETVAISLSTPGAGNYFKEAPGGAWHCQQTNCTIGGAILTFYRTLGNSGLCGLTVLGLPTSNEISMNVPGHPEIVMQHFEHADVTYNPQHVGGAPPGSGPVFLLKQQITSVEVKQALAKVVDLTHKLTSIEQICKG